MNNKISEPRIATMTVEISVLKIGNNKMTISVFDQLYEEDCFNQFFQIKYPIWGKVNRKEGSFVIFQRDDQLRKMMIPSNERHYSFEDSIGYTISVVRGHLNILMPGYFIESIREIYKSKIHQFNTKRSEKISVYPPLKNVDTISFLEILTNEEMNLIQDQYNESVQDTNSFNKMVSSLKESMQLFIAV